MWGGQKKKTSQMPCFLVGFKPYVENANVVRFGWFSLGFCGVERGCWTFGFWCEGGWASIPLAEEALVAKALGLGMPLLQSRASNDLQGLLVASFLSPMQNRFQQLQIGEAPPKFPHRLDSLQFSFKATQKKLPTKQTRTC